MNWRSTGILLVVALGLGAFLYFYELGGEAERLDREAAGKRLFSELEADDVEWIALRTRDGAEARFERRETGWRMVEPIDFPASAAVERMADTLATIASESRFDEPGDDAEYGLDDASATVIRFGAGGEERALRLGRDTPVGTGRYARPADSPAVHTVARHRAASFANDLDALREREVLDFDPASVTGVELDWPGGRVVASRAAPGAAQGGGEGDEEPAPDAGWRLESPLETPADDAALDGLLTTLSLLRAEGFRDRPSEAELALFASPAFEVTLAREGDAPPLRIVLAGPGEAGVLYARTPGVDTLFTLPAERLDDFPREVVAYRDRQLARFAVSEAAHLDFYFRGRGGDPVVVRARRADAGWTAEPEDFAAGRVARALSALSRLEAEDIVAESMGPAELAALGLAPATAIVSVFGEAPEGGEGGSAPSAPRLAEVQIGRTTPDGIVARVAGRDTVYRLSLDVAEEIPVSLESFRSHFRAAPEVTGEPPVDDATAEPTPSEESP